MRQKADVKGVLVEFSPEELARIDILHLRCGFRTRTAFIRAACAEKVQRIEDEQMKRVAELNAASATRTEETEPALEPEATEAKPDEQQ